MHILNFLYLSFCLLFISKFCNYQLGNFFHSDWHSIAYLIYQHLQVLRKELDVLRENVLKAEAVTKAAKKKFNDESDKISELQAQFKVADDIRQEAYAHFQSMKKQAYEKVCCFDICVGLLLFDCRVISAIFLYEVSFRVYEVSYIKYFYLVPKISDHGVESSANAWRNPCPAILSIKFDLI